MSEEVHPSDILHFSEGLLYSFNKLLDMCPNTDFRISMKSIVVTDWARNIKYWKKKLLEEKEKRQNTKP